MLRPLTITPAEALDEIDRRIRKMQEDGSLEDDPEVLRLKLVFRAEVDALAPDFERRKRWADELLRLAAAHIDPALATLEPDDIKLALERFMQEKQRKTT